MIHRFSGLFKQTAKRAIGLVAFSLFLIVNISQASNWNSPYSDDKLDHQVYYTSFSSPPKHLDPVISYNSNEWTFLSQIYEPPLQYHYLKRPYSLEPLTLKSLPRIRYFDKAGSEVSADADVAYSEYLFELKDGVRYQPHPAFVKQGELFKYHELSKDQLKSIKTVNDFKMTATRALVAEDYIYAIKRMALRQNHSPIFDSMKPYIVGFDEFSKQVTQAFKDQIKVESSNSKLSYFPLRNYALEGAEVLDDRRFKIIINGVYPQFLYWLTMNFFAPIPWEVDKFYKQQGLIEKNITLDTSPVGTGPYYLAENNPNQRMRLVVNPNHHQEFYPTDGLAENASPELLNDAGKKLPFIKEVVYSLEKESVPLWNKFLQGYYDASGVSSDSFDQAISISTGGNMELTEQMLEKDIQFLAQVQPTIFYFGFNMADPVVGGYSEKQQKLRQAISIALNTEEYISIFLNGRGEPAQGPIPPGLFGYQEGEQGINPYVYEWKKGRAQRKSIEQAKQLLTEAGYPNGRTKQGEPLTIHYDSLDSGPDSQSMLNWYRKQFAKLGINLVIRSSDYNRFQDKVRKAKVQTFSWGWNADYPDPENFLFLLYGGNAAIHTDGGGVNGANYDNPEFNRLFEKMKTMPNGEKRLKVINQMLDIVRKDAPWSWGFNPKALALYHSWLKNVWPNALANNTIKYKRIDMEVRDQQRINWNQPVIWPLVIVLLLLLISIWPLTKAYRARQNTIISSNKTEAGGQQ